MNLFILIMVKEELTKELKSIIKKYYEEGLLLKKYVKYCFKGL